MRTSASFSDAPFDNIVVAHASSDSEAHGHFSGDALNTVGDRITIPDARLLFSGHFERAGANLILSGDGQKYVVSNYFKGNDRAELFSPDGASLSGSVVDALTGHVSYAQAGPTPGTANAIGHVAKLVGSASAIRNGVSIELNIGDNVYKGDVVQSGTDSALGLSFVDGTAFSLSSNARMVLNEMVYDPNGSSSSTLLSLVQGTITFVAGQIAKTGSMTVDTPVATMGIRGTAVLVEISADNGPTKFSVLTEPGNVTGSFVLYNKITGAPLGSVSQAGQITIVTPTSTGPPTLSQQIKTLADQQAERDIVRQVFSIAFPTFNLDDSHPKKFASIGSGVTPYGDDGFYPFPLAALPGIPKLAAAASPDAAKLPDLLVPFVVSAPTSTPVNTPVNTPPVITVTAASTFQSGGVGNVEDTQSSTPGNKSFSTADHVIISDPNINTAPFFDVAVPYVAGTGKIVSAVGPASAPAGFNLLSLVSIDPATGVVTYDPSTFRFLGANEKAVYLIAFDSQSGPDTVHETLQFTVKGLDDAPVFPAANVTLSLSEIAGRTGFSGPNAHTVLLPFQDFDFSDVASGYSVSVLHATASGVTAGLPHDAAALDAALRSYLTVESVTKSLGSTEGLVTEVVSAPDNAFDYLAAGEKLDLSYTIQVTDAFGALGIQTMTVTVTGSNDAPVLAADMTVHSTVERPATTHAPGATQDTASGSLAFTDVDLTDTHHVTATLDNDAVTCPDGTIPATTLAALQAAMTAAIATGVSSGTPNIDDPDSTGTGSGSLTWNFSVPDHLLDFLRDGQTLKLTYDITVTDDSGSTTGASSTQPVTLMITGTNDAPVILCATNPPVQNVTTDDHHQTILCPAAGTVSVSDADIGDTLTGSVIGDASVTYNGSATLPCDVDVASLISAGAVTFDSVVTDGGATVLHWVYNPGKVNLDFLKHGDTLTINYTAQVNDGHGDVGSQPLTVTLTDGCAGSVIARDSDSFIFPQISGQQADASLNSVRNDPPHQDIASLFEQAGSDVFYHWPADPTAHHQGHHPGDPFVVIDPAQHDISSNDHAHLAANDFIIHPGFG